MAARVDASYLPTPTIEIINQFYLPINFYILIILVITNILLLHKVMLFITL